MKPTLLWGILIVSTMKLYAQVPLMGDIYLTAKVDSLKATLPSKKGLERISTLLSLEKSTVLWKLKGDTAYLYQIQQELTRYPGAQGHYRYFKAQQEAKEGNMEKAFLDSKSAYEFYRIHSDSVGVVSALLNMGMLARKEEKSTVIQPRELYLKEAMELSQYAANPELQLLYCNAFVNFLDRKAFSTDSQIIAEIEKGLRVIRRYPQYEVYAPFLLNFLAIIYESKHDYAKNQQINLEEIAIFKKKYRSCTGAYVNKPWVILRKPTQVCRG